MTINEILSLIEEKGKELKTAWHKLALLQDYTIIDLARENALDSISAKYQNALMIKKIEGALSILHWLKEETKKVVE